MLNDRVKNKIKRIIKEAQGLSYGRDSSENDEAWCKQMAYDHVLQHIRKIAKNDKIQPDVACEMIVELSEQAQGL